MLLVGAAVTQTAQAAPLEIPTGDSNFTAAIRILGQFDAAYYVQGGSAVLLPVANGPDLSSGTNIRRAQLGVQGKLFGDWSYFVNTEFGGSGGTESQGRIQSLYIQYDGLKPFAVRIGAYPPAAGLEDSTSSSDTLFLERAAPSDILRNTVGGDGRDAASVFYAGDGFFAALSWTGGKVADAAVFDEQNAALGRVSYLAYSDRDAKLVLSASGAHVFRPADTAPGPNVARTLTLSSAPELTVDSTGTKLISTGAIDANSATIWGAEAALQWHSLYAQGGYFDYRINQRLLTPPPALPKSDLDFNGWYLQASWVLTGETRVYKTDSAAFASPKPDSVWGAWELGARYSVLDLNDNSGNAGLVTGGVRGGEQKIWSAGINWYPNSALRFAADYQHIDISRLGNSAPFLGLSVGQKLDAVSLRAQISL
ncbi:MAG TPA: porin [Rhizomicrobium sp.]|nr:porin [Rhizomicrobium sp.]